jgi:CRP-like cAMP-binding protein
MRVDILSTYLTAHGSFTAAELARIAAAASPKKLQRHDQLLQAGEVCRAQAFVTSGLLRLHRVGADGTEQIMRFAAANWWMCDLESFHHGLPAKGVIEALEESEVLLFSKEKWEALQRDIPAFNSLHTQILSRSLEAQCDRLHTALGMPAKERYEVFVKAFPAFHNRIPLRMVAAYLGVSRETLSRVRKQSMLTKS